MTKAAYQPTNSPSNLPPAADAPILDEAVAMAERLLKLSQELQTASELRESGQMARLMADPAGKAFLFAMVDEVFRSRKPAVEAARWRRLIGFYGLPKYPAAMDRGLMWLGGTASRFLPGIVMPTVAAKMRAETARVILNGEPKALDRYLDSRRKDGFDINLNHLGEAVLGEEEAQHRLEAILGHLKNPKVDYISVKISAIYSQINLLAWDETLEEIKNRLRLLYRAALPERKFVNLDMEEYRDLELTMAAFMAVLEEENFQGLSAGIVLQAYLPDSWDAQRRLVDWAKRRVAAGGAPIKIRLVKGANLAMEAVEAEMHGWYPAPYGSKAETDANFRRMLEFGCQPANAVAAKLGVASHNLFDVALALVLRERLGVTDAVEIEMLEGMANHQARAVKQTAGEVLLYAPAVGKNDFLSAMAYLIRRLDENTAPENFLHDLFALEPGSAAWEKQLGKFKAGWEGRHALSGQSRRMEYAVEPGSLEEFENEPDTDWTQPWARQALKSAIEGWDSPVRPPLSSVEEVVERARAAQEEWEQRPISERRQLLRRAAEVMGKQRFQAMACMRLEGKKAGLDGDAEVSEAIDFARYYAEFEVPAELRAKALGVVVVTPPWNFPYAIPCGGVLAALMAGNAVILKPAPEAVETAWLLARQLWEAGIPRDVLQFFPCEDGETGKSLITHPAVAAVVLTGSSQTARMFQDWRPELRLFAETSGKNALVITAQADRELAIKDLVRSAFGHSGQKCSAASLAIIEAEVYDAPDFRRQLRDAAASLVVGPATEPGSMVTPLIQEPSPALKRALTTLEPGEEWLLEPRNIGDDPCLWSPGIKLGVKPGSWLHQTECFGPVLGLMRADSLEQAIEWQNATEYGLTAGIHSLDPQEIAFWQDRVQGGNLYVNRPITGAIVRRQPFGGWKLSSIGPGAKAGGPNYVASFCRFEDEGAVESEAVLKSYKLAAKEHYWVGHDSSGLRCEGNLFRYRPCRGVVLRLESRDEVIIERATWAARLAQVPLIVSVRDEECDEEFAARLPELAQQSEFLRTVLRPGDEVLRAAYGAGLNWIEAPVTGNGRQELKFWYREQAVTRTLHRYGLVSAVESRPMERNGFANAN